MRIMVMQKQTTAINLKEIKFSQSLDIYDYISNFENFNLYYYDFYILYPAIF